VLYKKKRYGMKALEMEMVVPMNGKLPSFFQEIFGKKCALLRYLKKVGKVIYIKKMRLRQDRSDLSRHSDDSFLLLCQV